MADRLCSEGKLVMKMGGIVNEHGNLLISC